MKSLDQAVHRFRQLYGGGEISALRAPARINILGEHVDYVSYLPTASLAFGSREHEMLMLFRPTDRCEVRGASMDKRFSAFRFSLNQSQPPGQNQQNWEEFVFNRPIPLPHWSNYVKGAISFAQWKSGAKLKHGFDFLIDSTIPPNSGASSSSALTVLAGAAIRMVNQIEFSLGEIAQESSQAEWFLGTRGGALDHKAICLARPGHAVHIFHWKDDIEQIPLPDKGYCWVTFFSHAADKGREIMLEYNERAAVSRLLIPAFWNDREREVPETATLEDIAQIYPQTFLECERVFPALVKERRNRPLKLRDRLRHHTGETVRVKAAVALPSETSYSVDARMRVLGQLITRSHHSLRDLYEVYTPEVDRLIDAVTSDPQVYGARLMGGGFGGNVLALTTVENAAALIDHVQAEFYTPQNRDGVGEAAVMISTPGDGLSAVKL
jgi:galactokinase